MFPDARAASGTSWQPASSAMRGVTLRAAGWSVMIHGQAFLTYTSDPSPRGDDQIFSTNMAMVRASRLLGAGVFEARVMATAEPTMGSRGYPLLLQTGETVDGLSPLFDRQHPHDMIMELATAYHLPLSSDFEIVGYFGVVGEPAIGPTPFMHRISGMDIPSAPISHHFLDATHITNGVLTLGIVSQQTVKIEASVFNGREPDQNRWNLEAPRFDSYALRVTVNPNDDLSFQASIADLSQPERLHPGIDQVKLTASATYNRRLPGGNWQITAAFGRNRRRRTIISLAEARRTFPAPVLDHYVSLADFGGVPEDSLFLLFPSRVQTALLLESRLRLGPATAFARVEKAQKDELFDPTDLRHSEVFDVGKLHVGYIHDVATTRAGRLGIGAAASLHVVPQRLRGVYGRLARSYQIFTRFRL